MLVHLGDGDIEVAHRAALGEAHLDRTQIEHVHAVERHVYLVAVGKGELGRSEELLDFVLVEGVGEGA